MNFCFLSVLSVKVFFFNERIENRLVFQRLRGLSGLENLGHDVVLDCLNLGLQVELVKALAEVPNVVFIIHFSKLLEDHQLVDRTMDLLAPRIFKFLQSLTVLICVNNELPQKVIGSRQYLLVSGLLFTGRLDCINYRFMNRLPLWL